MKPLFVVVSRIDYASCCAMAKRLGRKNGAVKAFRFLYLCALGLYLGFGTLISAVGIRTGDSSVLDILLFVFSVAVLILIFADGVSRLKGYLLLRHYRKQKLSWRKYEIFDDGISDDTLSARMLPYDFSRYHSFSEDSKRFYLLKDDECFSFDKKSFVEGKPEVFRNFIKQKLHEASLLYGDETERNRMD